MDDGKSNDYSPAPTRTSKVHRWRSRAAKAIVVVGLLAIVVDIAEFFAGVTFRQSRTEGAARSCHSLELAGGEIVYVYVFQTSPRFPVQEGAAFMRGRDLIEARWSWLTQRPRLLISELPFFNRGIQFPGCKIEYSAYDNANFSLWSVGGGARQSKSITLLVPLYFFWVPAGLLLFFRWRRRHRARQGFEVVNKRSSRAESAT